MKTLSMDVWMARKDRWAEGKADGQMDTLKECGWKKGGTVEWKKRMIDIEWKGGKEWISRGGEDGKMGGRKEKGKDEQMRWMNGRMKENKGGRMAGRVDERMAGGMEEKTGGRMEGQKNEWQDAWIHGWL